MPTKEELSLLMRDRSIIIGVIAVLVLCLILCIVGFIGLKTSDVQLPVRYSDYGLTNTYRDKWYYLLSFPAFGLLIGGFHSLIVAKLLPKSREVAIGFLMTTGIVLVVAIIVSLAILHLVSLSI